MSLVNDFQCAIWSFGEHVVDYIGTDNLLAVRVSADDLTASADVSIVLASASWEDEERAIDQMLALRELFLDDLSFDYRFDSADNLAHTTSTKAATVQFA